MHHYQSESASIHRARSLSVSPARGVSGTRSSAGSLCSPADGQAVQVVAGTWPWSTQAAVQAAAPQCLPATGPRGYPALTTLHSTCTLPRAPVPARSFTKLRLFLRKQVAVAQPAGGFHGRAVSPRRRRAGVPLNTRGIAEKTTLPIPHARSGPGGQPEPRLTGAQGIPRGVKDSLPATENALLAPDLWTL